MKSRLLQVFRVFMAMGPRCSLCGVPSPHRFPHRPGCHVYRYPPTGGHKCV